MTNTERAELVAQRAILTIVAVAAGAASFTHMHDWTMANSPQGTPGWFGWANACISELVPVAALLTIRQGRRARRTIVYPMFLLLASATLSLAAQLSVAKASPSGWLLSAVPALAFIALSKLVLSGAGMHRQETPVTSTGMPPATPAVECASSSIAPLHGPTPARTANCADSPPREPLVAPQRVRPRVLTSASKVQAAATKLPADATLAEIAATAGVSESTVRRHLPVPRRQQRNDIQESPAT